MTRRGLALLLAAAISGTPASAGRLNRGRALEAFGPALQEAADRLADALHPAAGHGHAVVKDALLRADSAVLKCMQQPATCRSGFRRIIDELASVVVGTSDTDLRQRAAATLGTIAVSRGVDVEDLRRIVSACEMAVAQRTLPSQHLILYALDAAALNPACNAEMLHDIIGIAATLLEGSPLPEDGAGRPNFFFDLADIIPDFVTRFADDGVACTSVLLAARRIMESTQGSGRHHDVRSAVMVMLDRLLVGVGPGEPLLHVLEMLEAYAADLPGELDLEDGAAMMLGGMARKLGDEHLGRLLAVCMQESLLATTGAAAALTAVARRLAADCCKSCPGGRLQLLAEAMGGLERAKKEVACAAPLRALARLPVAEASRHPGVHSTALGASLPLEVAMHIDSFVPPMPEERARAQIVDICARRARQRHWEARALLQAASTVPRRVGLRAAQAFQALSTLDGLAEVVPPELFLLVGDRLRASLVPDEALGVLDASRVARIASVLLDAAQELSGGWLPEQQLPALRPLCALAHRWSGVCSPLAA